MEEFYRLNNHVLSYQTDVVGGEVISSMSCGGIDGAMMVDDMFHLQQVETEATIGLNMSDMIKTQIVNHPLYPNLVSAYIECQKVGAPPQVASLLEEIGLENHPTSSSCIELGADPQLDNFMESYCEVLHQYKNELSKPFDEATTFLSNIELELSNLCKGSFSRTSDSLSAMNEEVTGTSEEEPSYGEVEMAGDQNSFCTQKTNQDIKGMLLKKYSGYLSSLKKEFLKKRKKEKLPKDARMALFDWWNTHYKWPYPTEEQKSKLSEITGLDQKQINNWFINQRKRHWKPPEDMRFALMDGSGDSIKVSNLYNNGETEGHVI